jgi:hypothetical protein
VLPRLMKGLGCNSFHRSRLSEGAFLNDPQVRIFKCVCGVWEGVGVGVSTTIVPFYFRVVQHMQMSEEQNRTDRQIV